MYTMYTNVSNKTPSCIHSSLYMVQIVYPKGITIRVEYQNLLEFKVMKIFLLFHDHINDDPNFWLRYSLINKLLGQVVSFNPYDS